VAIAGIILPDNLEFESKLVDILEGFLKDLEDVRLAALSHLSVLLPPLSVKQALRVLKWIPELALDDNWRVRKRIAKMLSDFARYCSEHKSQLSARHSKKKNAKNKQHLKAETFVQLCVSLCEDPVWAVRQTAAKTVVSSIQSLKAQDERDRMYEELNKRFGESSVYSQRLLFVRICEFACRNLGRDHFKNTLLFPVFEKLADDPVRFVYRAQRHLAAQLRASPQRPSPKRTPPELLKPSTSPQFT